MSDENKCRCGAEMERKHFKGGFPPIWRCRACEYGGQVKPEPPGEKVQPEHLCCICDSPSCMLYPNGKYYCSQDKPSWQEIEIPLPEPQVTVPQDDEELCLRAIFQSFPKDIIKVLTFERWKDGIEVEYLTGDVKSFIEKVRKPLRERLEAAEHDAKNLLAVIHRDGGHYTGEHGLAKSCTDAEKVVCDLRRDLDKAQFDLGAAEQRAVIAERELSRHASIEEKAHLQTIDERDAAEEALSQAYYLVKGESPQWSNLFGFDQAIEDIDDAQKCLRAEIKSLEAERDRLKEQLIEIAAENNNLKKELRKPHYKLDMEDRS